MKRRINSSHIIMLLVLLTIAADHSGAARTTPASPVPDKSESSKQAAFQDAVRV